MIIAAFALFLVGWTATGSFSGLLTSLTGYVLDYGLKAICIGVPILVIVWLFYKIIKP